MKRTISVMLGKGSVSHNRRDFKAVNVDGDRTALNITYCNTPIKEVYHQLFDEALSRYNAKQKRSDRHIADYYEKIRTGKQEKLFHEVIFQIGNKDDAAAWSEDGQLAAKVLDAFMREFQHRNPYLHVFSAHLHMDEATPHLHIDFVPFITESKRGLDTRVSLKKALAAQGFEGGTRGATEWNQWVQAEKEELAQIMERHGIRWERLGTHNEHLSVLDFKKGQRAKEVNELENKLSEKQLLLNDMESKEQSIATNARQYDEHPDYQLSEPKSLMSAKSYYEKTASPLVKKLKDVIRTILGQYFERTKELGAALRYADERNEGLSNALDRYQSENKQLKAIAKDFGHLYNYLGKDKTKEIINTVKAQEEVKQRGRRSRDSHTR